MSNQNNSSTINEIIVSEDKIKEDMDESINRLEYVPRYEFIDKKYSSVNIFVTSDLYLGTTYQKEQLR